MLQLLGQTITLPGLRGDLTSPGSSAVENGVASPAGTLIINNAADYAYGGSLRDGTASAAMNLVKNGSGTQTIAGNNTFTGSVTINAGVLQLGSATALNTTAPRPVAFGADGTLRLAGNSVVVSGLTGSAANTFVENQSDTQAILTIDKAASTTDTFAGTLRDGTGKGPLGLTKAGSGTLVLTGANTLTGPVSVTGGKLQGNAASLPSPITLANNTNVTFDQTTDGLRGTAISGAGSLSKIGAGVLTLQANNGYTGATAINGGTLKLAGYVPPSGAALWLDAADTAHLVKDGSNLVSQWQDKAGGTDKLAQADVNRQPTYVASGINGLPVVHFSTAGTADFLSNSTDYRNQPFTIFSVSRLTGGANARLIADAVDNNWLLGYWGGKIDQAHFDGWVTNNGNGPTADQSPHMYEAAIPGGGNNAVYVYDDRNPNVVAVDG